MSGVGKVPVRLRQDHGTAARSHVHESLGRQHLDGFPHDGPARAEFLDQVVFRWQGHANS
jgi:hypothetical protein